MPTSRSPKVASKSKSPARPAPLQSSRAGFIRPLILVIVLAVLVVILFTLPASLVKRFLPPSVVADDFSGSLWHGSAGTVLVNSQNAGAIEWHIHPWSLLTLTLSADLHWVKVSMVADATAAIDRHGLVAHDVIGGGAVESLTELGIPPGWHGTANFKFSEIKVAFEDNVNQVTAAVGDLSVADLAAPQLANGANLGGYVLHLGPGAITADGNANAELSDTGGPLEVHATIHYSPKDRTGILSGTIKERPDAPPALRGELDNLAQLHARDADGRLPVDVEFRL
jgi:hypothetical protein